MPTPITKPLFYHHNLVSVGTSIIFCTSLALLNSAYAQVNQTTVSSTHTEDELLQELSLEALLDIKVAVATKTIEKSSLSPAIMSVLTEQDIANYGYQTVAEALAHVAGFIDNYDLAMHNFGVRGINSGVRSGSRTIKFMLDGQEIAFRSTSQNFIDQELIPMNMIKRIEIVRGPVSALYGANAFLAVVNIVTKSGQQFAEQGNALTLQLNSIANAGSGYQLNGYLADYAQDWDYAFGGSVAQTDRAGILLPRRSPAFDDISNTQSMTDDASPKSLYFRSTYNLHDYGSFNANLHYQQLRVENPFADINPLTSAGTSQIGLDNFHAKLNYQLNLTEQISVQSYLAYGKGGTLTQDKIELGADNFYFQRRFGYHSVDFGAEVFMTVREQDSLLFGFDTRQEQHQIETFSRVERTSRQQTPLTPIHDERLTNTGWYVQYLWQFNPQWRAIAGVRYDDDSVIGAQTSTRLGVVGQLPYDIIFKALAGSSFQAPSPELLYRTAVQAGDIIGNPDLQPQQAKTLELSAAVPLNEIMHLTVSYFNTKVNNLVVFNSDSSNLFANNSTGSTTNGVELELRMLWQGLDSYVNYSWQNTMREPSLRSLFILDHRQHGELYPVHAVNFGVSYFWPAHKLRISWNNRWLDRRPASSSNVLYANQFYYLSSYLDSDLTISSSQFSLIPGKVTNIQFKLKDLFDGNYVNPGFGGIEFPSLGRHWLLSFEQHF